MLDSHTNILEIFAYSLYGKVCYVIENASRFISPLLYYTASSDSEQSSSPQHVDFKREASRCGEVGVRSVQEKQLIHKVIKYLALLQLIVVGYVVADCHVILLLHSSVKVVIGVPTRCHTNVNGTVEMRSVPKRLRNEEGNGSERFLPLQN